MLLGRDSYEVTRNILDFFAGSLGSPARWKGWQTGSPKFGTRARPGSLRFALCVRRIMQTNGEQERQELDFEDRSMTLS